MKIKIHAYVFALRVSLQSAFPLWRLLQRPSLYSYLGLVPCESVSVIWEKCSTTVNLCFSTLMVSLYFFLVIYYGRSSFKTFIFFVSLVEITLMWLTQTLWLLYLKGIGSDTVLCMESVSSNFFKSLRSFGIFLLKSVTHMALVIASEGMYILKHIV